MKIYNINTETEAGLTRYEAQFKTDSELFKACETEFWKEFNGANPASELEAKYFSEDAIYTKKGAIQGMIEQIFEVMQEYNLAFIYLNDKRLDFSCCID